LLVRCADRVIALNVSVRQRSPKAIRFLALAAMKGSHASAIAIPRPGDSSEEGRQHD